jgi:CheY-like chemotaxis protein
MGAARSGLQNLNVMVVDHDPWTRLHVTSALDELGVSVAEASNGVTALRRALADAPHVVIVGSALPELGAPELMHGLRSDPRTRHTALVALSNVRDGDADLQLPCTPHDLLASVVYALEVRSQALAAPMFQTEVEGRDTTAPKRARSRDWLARVAPTLAPRLDRRGARLSKR